VCVCACVWPGSAFASDAFACVSACAFASPFVLCLCLFCVCVCAGVHGKCMLVPGKVAITACLSCMGSHLQQPLQA
jgi:hypothetical protein